LSACEPVPLLGRSAIGLWLASPVQCRQLDQYLPETDKHFFKPVKYRSAERSFFN
jgi:hypothetical protein